MPQNSISAQLSNLQQLVADLEAIENGGKKAISNTIKDVKARAPGWIAQEVTAVYNIKKSEITPSGSGKPKKMAGSIQITGETIEELAITYKGRLLTPVHFGMTPKAPPRGKSYTLKASVLKGQKKVIGRYLNTRTPGGPFSQRSHNILMSQCTDRHGYRKSSGDQSGKHRHQEADHHLGATDDNQRPHQRGHHAPAQHRDQQAPRAPHEASPRPLSQSPPERRTARPQPHPTPSPAPHRQTRTERATAPRRRLHGHAQRRKVL